MESSKICKCKTTCSFSKCRSFNKKWVGSSIAWLLEQRREATATRVTEACIAISHQGHTHWTEAGPYRTWTLRLVQILPTMVMVTLMRLMQSTIISVQSAVHPHTCWLLMIPQCLSVLAIRTLLRKTPKLRSLQTLSLKITFQRQQTRVSALRTVHRWSTSTLMSATGSEFLYRCNNQPQRAIFKPKSRMQHLSLRGRPKGVCKQTRARCSQAPSATLILQLKASRKLGHSLADHFQTQLDR